MKILHKILIISTLMIFGIGCTDLEITPRSTITSEIVFDSPSSYKAFLARVYAGLAISGQRGPSGDPDIRGIDEGFSNYLRQYWKAQELTTDEAVISWGDEGLPDYHEHDWTSANQFVTALYNRIFYQVSIANQYLRETTDAKLNERGVTGELRTDIQRYRAEVRFLRALSYWHGIDLYGSIPFVTENDGIGNVKPKQATRQEIFNFIESELKAIEADLAAPKQGEYGRADQAAAWTLLAKLYLNAQVYTGQARATDCITYCNKVISSGAYSLQNSYRNIFKADNNTSPETIFVVTFDGQATQTFGGMTFLINASVGGNMNAANYGINGGWWGLRTTSAFVNLFPDITGDADKRAIFFTNGHTREIASISNFFDGYAMPKFVNVTSAGAAGARGDFPDTDFPMFRLADVYLMYAEAVLRGGTGGNATTALGYVNQLRQRAYGNDSGNIAIGQLTLDFLLDERARELAWEGHRRTDLIRYNRFTENGIWPWKGGVAAGRTTQKFRDLLPIPSAELLANPTLTQNPGY